MFEIYGGRAKLTQWSKDQKLIMDRLPVGAEVLFYNDPTVDDPLITEVHEINNDGSIVRVCDIPNVLLTEAKRIKVKIPATVFGLYGNAHKYVGQREKYFDVEPASKPDDYVYEETETEGGAGVVSDERIEAAVEKYMDQNGVSGVVSDNDIATDEEVNDVLNNIFGS